MRKKDGALSTDDIKRFVRYLKEEERSAATIEKYTRDINALIRYLVSNPVTKTGLMEWKKQLCRTFYTAEKDLGRLADILGHSSIDTTRIYTAESGASHARKVEQLHLIVT